MIWIGLKELKQEDYYLNIHHNASLYFDGLTNGFLKCESLKMKTCKLINRVFSIEFVLCLVIYLKTKTYFGSKKNIFFKLRLHTCYLLSSCWGILLARSLVLGKEDTTKKLGMSSWNLARVWDVNGDITYLGGDVKVTWCIIRIVDETDEPASQGLNKHK